MAKTISIYKLFEINKTIDKLITQDKEYSINVAYKLYKAKVNIEEAADYVIEIIRQICGEDVDFNNISEKNNTIINGIFTQYIDIEVPDINLEDIVSNNNVKATLPDIANISLLFGKSEQ